MSPGVSSFRKSCRYVVEPDEKNEPASTFASGSAARIAADVRFANFPYSDALTP